MFQDEVCLSCCKNTNNAISTLQKSTLFYTLFQKKYMFESRNQSVADYGKMSGVRNVARLHIGCKFVLSGRNGNVICRHPFRFVKLAITSLFGVFLYY